MRTDHGIRTHARAIGPAGTVARVAVGGAFLFLGLWLKDDGVIRFDVTATTAIVTLAIFASVLTLQAVRLLWIETPLRATGSLAHYLNVGVFVALAIIDTTSKGAYIYYGASMLLAAARGVAGCEVVAITNWLLRRDDQVGCMLFGPIDAAEARARSGRDSHAVGSVWSLCCGVGRYDHHAESEHEGNVAKHDAPMGRV